MKSKTYILIAAGIVVVILAGLFFWHPWSGGVKSGSSPAGSVAAIPQTAIPASATPSAVVAPLIPQVSQPSTSTVVYSAKLNSKILTLSIPGKATTTVITSGEVTTVYRNAISAVIKQMQATASSSPSSSAAIAEDLQDLAETMGLQPLSTSYTILYGQNKIYFAARGISSSGAQGTIAIFSYDTITGSTQVAALPDVGLQQVSDIALSPDGRYLVLFQCDAAPRNLGCYRLSYGFFIFDLTSQQEVGSVAGTITPAPQSLYSFGGWLNDTSFSYDVYQLTTATGADIVQLGNASYAPSSAETYAIP